jgi:hypothetical protein
MPTASSIPICNAALTRSGDTPITSFDEGSPQAAVLSENYDDIVNGFLSSCPWKFASRTFQLSLHNATVDPPWMFGYQLPPDLLALRVVEANGFPIPWELMSDVILCNVGLETPVLAKYTYRVDENDWPKFFRLAIIATLEPLILRAIGERYDEADRREKRAIALQAMARNRDTQSQTARNPFQAPIMAARHGYWPFDPHHNRPPWR